MSFNTNLPAPESRGNPCSPLPKSGTQHSGVVTKNDSVPIVITITSSSPKIPILGVKIPNRVKTPIDIIRIPNPFEKPYVLLASCHWRFLSTNSPSLFLYCLYSGASFS